MEYVPTNVSEHQCGWRLDEMSPIGQARCIELGRLLHYTFAIHKEALGHRQEFIRGFALATQSWTKLVSNPHGKGR